MADEFKEGPGRFNYPEAFCIITYTHESKDPKDEKKVVQKSVRVWNSRDGIAPPSVTLQDGLIYTRDAKAPIVCQPDFIPPIYSSVIIDANTKGEPKLILASKEWLEQHRRVYGNPQAAIKRMEGQLRAAEKSLEAERKLTAKQITEITDLCAKLDDLKATQKKQYEEMSAEILEKTRIISNHETEIGRLAHYETLCITHSKAFDLLPKKPGDPNIRGELRKLMFGNLKDGVMSPFKEDAEKSVSDNVRCAVRRDHYEKLKTLVTLDGSRSA